MSRTLRELNLSATRVSACLALAMLAGCGGGKSAGTVQTDTNTPVNTGLANIDDRPAQPGAMLVFRHAASAAAAPRYISTSLTCGTQDSCSTTIPVNADTAGCNLRPERIGSKDP